MLKTEKAKLFSGKEPLLILVVGPENELRGVGKSTFAAALGAEKMVGARAYYDIKACDNEIVKYRAGGWQVSREQHVKHLVYATDKIHAVGMGYAPALSMNFNFVEFGTYIDESRKVCHILPECTIIVFEVQRKLDSRKSMRADGPDDELLSALEMQRHFGIKMIAEGHSYNRIEKRFREFADCVIEVQNQSHEYAPNDYNRDTKTSAPLRTTWKLHVFDGAGAYQRYLETKDAALFMEREYTFEGNIFKVIDSHSGRAHFMNGLQGGKNFDQKITALPGYDMNSMTEYCKLNPIKKDKVKKECAA